MAPSSRPASPHAARLQGALGQSRAYCLRGSREEVSSAPHQPIRAGVWLQAFRVPTLAACIYHDAPPPASQGAPLGRLADPPCKQEELGEVGPWRPSTPLPRASQDRRCAVQPGVETEGSRLRKAVTSLGGLVGSKQRDQLGPCKCESLGRQRSLEAGSLSPAGRERTPGGWQALGTSLSGPRPTYPVGKQVPWCPCVHAVPTFQAVQASCPQSGGRADARLQAGWTHRRTALTQLQNSLLHIRDPFSPVKAQKMAVDDVAATGLAGSCFAFPQDRH